MNKITQEMLKAGHVNGEQISGLVLLQDSRRQMTKTKKPFFYHSRFGITQVLLPFLRIKVWTVRLFIFPVHGTSIRVSFLL